MKSYFSGSPEQLLSQFVQEAQVSYGELEELLDKIKQQEE